MANVKDSGTNKEYATVDTLPGSSGFFTNEIDPRILLKDKKVSRIFFSIRETVSDESEAPSTASVVTVVLQYKCDNDADWTEYVPMDGSELAIGNRIIIDDMAANVRWRAGVVSDGYTSGSVRFGFDW